jgi:hypothetical protein
MSIKASSSQTFQAKLTDDEAIEFLQKKAKAESGGASTEVPTIIQRSKGKITLSAPQNATREMLGFLATEEHNLQRKESVRWRLAKRLAAKMN